MVYNYFSARDAVVCNGFGESGSGLGCAGASCVETPANYADVDVSDRVGGHMAYTDPENGCVDHLVATFRADAGSSTDV